jgi:hypothetical protein
MEISFIDSDLSDDLYYNHSHLLSQLPLGRRCAVNADRKSFSDRTNIKSYWVGEHRIVSSASGDMAYEYGTLHMPSDSKSNQATGHEEFEAVMLIVYKAKKGVCEKVALTMQPLEKKARALNTPAKPARLREARRLHVNDATSRID